MTAIVVPFHLDERIEGFVPPAEPDLLVDRTPPGVRRATVAELRPELPPPGPLYLHLDLDVADPRRAGVVREILAPLGVAS